MSLWKLRENQFLRLILVTCGCLRLSFSQHLPAPRLEVDLQAAGPNTVVFTFDGNSVHQGTFLRSSRSVAVHTIDDLWSCGATPSGPRLFVLGSQNAGTYRDAAAICALRAGKQSVVIPLQKPTVITLYVWLRSPDLKAMITDEIANANWLFQRNLVGAVFTPVFVDGFSSEPPTKDEFERIVYTVHHNGKTLQLHEDNWDDLRQDEANFVKPGGINVYVGFGPNITSVSDLSTHHPRKDIVFVQDVPVLGATAHELAHAAGVDSPTDGDEGRIYENGHVPPAPADGTAFEPNNSMWPQSMVLHDRFTLGQVFWMNFSEFSYIEQSRTEPHFLVCPKDCPRYATDYPGNDPRVQLKAMPRAVVVGLTRAPRNASGPVCEVELNFACPQSVFAQLQNTAARVGAKLGMAAGLSDPDAVFKVQFEMAAGFDNHPHYCTPQELTDTLTKRFAEVCTLPGQCAHAKSQDFVDFWKKNVVAAGLIEATTSRAVAAWQEKQGSSAAGQTGTADAQRKQQIEYASKAYGAARSVIDVNHADTLQKVLGKRVLWVHLGSGDPSNDRAEQDILRALGIEVDAGCSNDVQDALAQLRRASFSTVVSNYGGGLGLEFISEMRQRGLKTPVILYSQGVTAQDRANAVAHGACGETDDPVALADLVFRALIPGAKDSQPNCGSPNPQAQDVRPAPLRSKAAIQPR